ncbi:MAG TPA: AraC family transcriptional regulator [Microscillaceae bacterium]|nr:AraC family transcriptional regulator [Microscillaceae bacterium]
MKALYFRMPKTEVESFRVQIDKMPYFYDTLHYHPELQITLIIKSKGTLFAGDGIHRFQPLDVLVMGSNLPHVLRNDQEYYDPNNEEEAHAISVFLKKESLGKGFLDLPEMQPVKELWHQASRGIRIQHQAPNYLTEQLEQIEQTQGLQRVVQLLNIFESLTRVNDQNREFLSSAAFSSPQKDTDNQRLNAVIDYVMKNYTREIKLSEIAEVAHMTAEAFCRYFKLRTRKTFSGFLNEIRIGNACQMLLTEQYNVSEVCFACGFNNLSNFNRQFKKFTQLTPSQYLKEYCFAGRKP